MTNKRLAITWNELLDVVDVVEQRGVGLRYRVELSVCHIKPANKKPVLRVLTNQKPVLSLLTNQRPVLRVMTNQRPVAMLRRVLANQRPVLEEF